MLLALTVMTARRLHWQNTIKIVSTFSVACVWFANRNGVVERVAVEPNRRLRDGLHLIALHHRSDELASRRVQVFISIIACILSMSTLIKKWYLNGSYNKIIYTMKYSFFVLKYIFSGGTVCYSHRACGRKLMVNSKWHGRPKLIATIQYL